MKKSDAFIEDRIRWRVSQYNLQESSNLLWEDVPLQYKAKIPQALGIPVLMSLTDENNYTVVCTQGMSGKNNDKALSFLHSQIRDFEGQPAKEHQYSHRDYLTMVLENNKKVPLQAGTEGSLSVV